MRKDETDHLALALLALTCAALAGMLLGSWELVLYPTLLIVGVLLAMSLVGRGRGLVVGVAGGVTVVLVVLFAILHAMGVADPSGEGSFLGWDPMTALYLFVVGAVFLSVSLIYALTDATDPDATDPAPTAEELPR